MARSSTENTPAPGKAKERVRQQRVIQAALEEFADRGYEGATWRSIARRADVSQGLIKFYFNDKMGLWQAALLHAHELLVSDLPPPPFRADENPDIETTAEWIRAYVRHAARHPEYIKMVMRESAAPNPRLAWAVQHVTRESNREFAWGIEQLQKQGFFKGLNPMLIQYAFLGAIHHPFLASEEVRAVHGVDMLSDEIIDAHADAIVALFLGDIGDKFSKKDRKNSRS